MKKRLRIRFYGDVQGVGFRYRTCRSAERLGLTGWVKNCPDGTVLCEVQGISADINEMLSDISRGAYIDITHTETENLPLSEDERGFRVNY